MRGGHSDIIGMPFLLKKWYVININPFRNTSEHKNEKQDVKNWNSTFVRPR